MSDARQLVPGLLVAVVALLVATACSSGAPVATSPVPSAVSSELASAVSSAIPPIATSGPSRAPAPGSSAGQTRTDPYGIAQVWVPAGTFGMGTDAASIAKLMAENPPDWVAEEFASEGHSTRSA